MGAGGNGHAIDGWAALQNATCVFIIITKITGREHRLLNTNTSIADMNY